MFPYMNPSSYEWTSFYCHSLSFWIFIFDNCATFMILILDICMILLFSMNDDNLAYTQIVMVFGIWNYLHTLGEVKCKSLKILANFLLLVAILQDWGPKFRSCKIFQILWENVYLARLSLKKCLSLKIPARFLQEKCIFFKDKNVRILQDKHFLN